ncbi:MAG: DsrE family protein, partial [Xanthomonadales bacterium]|nr:DsrE family protein [Xanthomonadales bacterium]
LEPIVREQLAAVSARTRSAGGKAGPAQALRFPRIAMAGGVYAMPAGTLMPAANLEHRLVIDAASGDTTAGGILRRLDAAARAVNLYALAGVAPQRLKVAVVLHGKATSAALDEKSYQAHFSTGNPNASLLGALHEAGVEVFVCGQALSHAGYAAGEVRADVRVALSAMTALVSLQADGYSLIP